MMHSISANTQAILLLTSPLMIGKSGATEDLLRPAEYNRLARFLRETRREPGDLLLPDARAWFSEAGGLIDPDRLVRLLARGFLLAQAIERWHGRAIWVLSRADAEYPRRLRARLREEAPPVLYGCGDPRVLDAGGLAVVGSRNADRELLEYARRAGRLAAEVQCAVVSGGARGVDQAAMDGAIGGGGRTVGVLVDGLERAVLQREHRAPLLEGRLVLLSPYDPAASFNVGHAMQRNKLIYALADAALVVSSDLEKGGTWAGAIEQLERLRLVPVYVRASGAVQRGLQALERRGARAWPEPVGAGAWSAMLMASAPVEPAPAPAPQRELWSERPVAAAPVSAPEAASAVSPAEELFAKVRELVRRTAEAQTEGGIAESLGVAKAQARLWLMRLVEEGVLEKLARPTRYRVVHASASREFGISRPAAGDAAPASA